MKNRIDEAFKNKPIFMPYFPLGYPDLETSIDVIEALATLRGITRTGKGQEIFHGKAKGINLCV